ncbi:MAG: AraC family transcriptional regulator [Eubacterium sp.]|nr:AraC family transcriptional regulator [Eubacterium sp.]
MTEEEWEAIKNRNKSYDGRIFCACKTTKIVCRPSCTSKIGKRESLEIFYNLEDALEAGYRPCYRCRPDLEDWEGAGVDLAMQVKDFIEKRYQEKFSMKKMADYLHNNEDYMGRVFKSVTGWTPLQYHNFIRCQKSLEYLKDREVSVSMAGYNVGFVSPSHYTKVFKSIYGISPSTFRKRFYQEEI